MGVDDLTALKHDRALDVALGNNRKTKKWKNKQKDYTKLHLMD